MKNTPFELDGVTPIVNTPFTDDLSIDYASLGKLVRRAVSDGVVGFIVPAVASEVGKLTAQERRGLLEATVDAAGHVQVIAGVSSDDLAESVSLAEHALGRGVTAVLCRAPEPLVDDASGLVAHFTELAHVGMKTLIIQDLAWGGAGMHIGTISRLYDEIPAFTAIKVETSPAGSKYTAILEATGGAIHVSCGWGLGQMIEALDRGVSTFTTTAINLPFIEVHRRYRAGDRDGARALFDEVSPMLIWCQQHIEVSIPFLKRYAVADGLFSTARLRAPEIPFDSHQERIAAELIAFTRTLESRLRRGVSPT